MNCSFFLLLLFGKKKKNFFSNVFYGQLFSFCLYLFLLFCFFHLLFQLFISIIVSFGCFCCCCCRLFFFFFTSVFGLLSVLLSRREVSCFSFLSFFIIALCFNVYLFADFFKLYSSFFFFATLPPFLLLLLLQQCYRLDSSIEKWKTTIDNG